MNRATARVSSTALSGEATGLSSRCGRPSRCAGAIRWLQFLSITATCLESEPGVLQLGCSAREVQATDQVKFSVGFTS